MHPDEQLRLTCLQLAVRDNCATTEEVLDTAKKFFEFCKDMNKNPDPEKSE